MMCPALHALVSMFSAAVQAWNGPGMGRLRVNAHAILKHHSNNCFMTGRYTHNWIGINPQAFNLISTTPREFLSNSSKSNTSKSLESRSPYCDAFIMLSAVTVFAQSARAENSLMRVS